MIVGDIPGGDEQQFPRTTAEMKRSHKVPILGRDNAPLRNRATSDLVVGRQISVRQFEGMDGILAEFAQQRCKPARKLCVHEPIHGVKMRSTLFVCAKRAAYVRTARMSSRSRSS